jgi:MFS transporter, DHA2 family, multidrug resistance protein
MNASSARSHVVPRAGRREWLALAVLALPTLLLSVDLSVLHLALPQLGADLGASSVQQLWIIDIYGFMIAGFLITMGGLGDRIGRRRLLLIGAALFAVASVAAAFSSSPEMLIAARALMGIAGATLMPSTLALISDMFRDAAQRGAAIGVWVSCFMGGMAFGPLIGGVVLQFFWWGAVFLLAVPVMALLLVAGPVLLPEFRDRTSTRPIDPLSVALSLVATLSTVWGIKELVGDGWQPRSAAAIVCAAVLGALFVLRQHRLAEPLVDLRLFGSTAFSGALVIALIGAAVGGGTILVVNLYLQLVEGLSPLRAGLLMLPSGLAMVATAMIATMITRTIRPAFVMAVGLLVAAGGYLLLTQATTVALVIVAVILSSAGSGPQAALTTELVLRSAPPEKAASAASMSETSGELGMALGFAVMGSIAGAVYGGALSGNLPAGLGHEATQDAQESIVGAAAAAGRLPDQIGAELLEAGRTAFTTGLHVVAGLSGILLVGLALIAVTALRHAPPTGTATAPADKATDNVTSVQNAN